MKNRSHYLLASSLSERILLRLGMSWHNSPSNLRWVLIHWKVMSPHLLIIWLERMPSWHRKSSTLFIPKVKWCAIFATCNKKISVLIAAWSHLEAAPWSWMLPVKWHHSHGQASTCIHLCPTTKPRDTFKSSMSWEHILNQLLNLMKLVSSLTVAPAVNMQDYWPLLNT